MAALTECGTARLDAAVGLSELFVSMPDTNKDIGVSRTIRQKWKGGTVIIKGTVMSAFQQDILFAMLAAALEVGDVCKPGDELLADEQMNMGLADKLDVINVQLSYPRLAELSGHRNSTKFRAAARDAVQTLAGVTVRGEGADESFAIQRLIAGAAGKGRAGVSVTLNWRLTLAVLGRGIYGAISLAERHKLSKTARIAHAWIACWLGAKSQNSIGVEKLAPHIFPANLKISERAQNKRLSTILRVLGEIGELPAWRVSIDDDGLALIVRVLPENSTSGSKKSTSIAAKNSTTGSGKQYHRFREKPRKPSIHAG